MIKGIALVLRFLLELCALGALGYWGFVTGGSALAKVGLGLGIPLVAAVAWGTFVAPKALVKVPGAVRLLVEVGVFVSATAALYVAGSTSLATALMLAYALDRVLLIALWQRLLG
jgi:Protein of unknown function (DUF2568)